MKNGKMNKRIRSLLLIILSFPFFFVAQEVRKSKTYIDTYYHGDKHFSIKEAAEIYHDLGNSELLVEIDFGNLKCGVDSLDEWLVDLAESKFVFKAPLPSGDLLLLTHNNIRSLELHGEVTFNGKKHKQIAYVNFFEIAQDGHLYQQPSLEGKFYDRITLNLQFYFLPKHFGVDKKPHHLKKKISVAIGKGIILKK